MSADAIEQDATEASTGGTVHRLPNNMPIPQFEGKEVKSADLILSGLKELDEDPNLVVGVDDRVRIVVVVRVTDVNHTLDSDGEFKRVAKAKVISAARVPFDPNDNDGGIIRA